MYIGYVYFLFSPHEQPNILVTFYGSNGENEHINIEINI